MIHEELGSRRAGVTATILGRDEHRGKRVGVGRCADGMESRECAGGAAAVRAAA